MQAGVFFFKFLQEVGRREIAVGDFGECCALPRRSSFGGGAPFTESSSKKHPREELLPTGADAFCVYLRVRLEFIIIVL